MSEAAAPVETAKNLAHVSAAGKGEKDFQAALEKLPAHLRGVAIAGRDHAKAAGDLKAQSQIDGVDRNQSIAEHLANAAKCAKQLEGK